MSFLPELTVALKATQLVESLSFSDLWPEEFYDEESGGSFDDVGETWVLNTALDERTCGKCGPLEGAAFLGEDLEECFPDAEDIDETTIAANLHDWCRCELVLAEEYESLDLEGLEGLF